MILLNCFEQYEKCLQRYQTAERNVETNCPLLPCVIQELIDQKSVFYIDAEHTLLLLHDRGRCYDLYYWGDLDRQNHCLQLPLDKPILVSFTLAKKAPWRGRNQVYWLEHGFRHYKTARRMVKKLDASKDHLPVAQYKPIFLEENDVLQVATSMAEAFDPMSDMIPSAGDLLDAVKEKRLIGLKSNAGELIAYEYFSLGRNFLTLMHIWVAPAYRSNGMGRILLQCLFQNGINRGTNRVYAWVNKGNVSSDKMHLAAGFQFDGRITEKFIFTKGE